MDINQVVSVLFSTFALPFLGAMLFLWIKDFLTPEKIYLPPLKNNTLIFKNKSRSLIDRTRGIINEWQHFKRTNPRPD